MYRYLIIYILETNFNSSFKIRYYTIGLYLTLTSLINTNFTKKTQMFKKLSIVLLIAIISITTYARTILLDNISPYSATSPIENTSLKDMEKAIRGACVQLKWKECKVIEPDHIEATLNVRTHSLVVNIYYSDKEYTIIYKDSKNLKYNGKKIHSAYQKWILNLDKYIQTNLIAAKY